VNIQMDIVIYIIQIIAMKKSACYVFNIPLKTRPKVDGACNKITQNVSTSENSNNNCVDFLTILL